MTTSRAISRVGAVADHPAVRRIGVPDLRDALRRGVDDFRAMPTHAVLVVLMYPLLGVFFARVAFGYDLLPLLFPLMAGFALIGPFAALGLYELSRRRELGLGTEWSDAMAAFRAPAIRSILALGLLLAALLVAWVFVADALYRSLFGSEAPDSMGSFLGAILTTPRGWALIVFGNAIGFVFAVAALSISVVSFPLLLDRDVGAAAAVETSIRAVRANPVPMALWGLVVAGLLVIGSIPLFVGLAVVLPVLGHATWHLYRKVVEA